MNISKLSVDNINTYIQNIKNYQNRITSNNITSLLPNQIFVFGSNLSGIHGAGAAKTAIKFGAIYGQEIGLQGNSYAIPTKNASISKTLSIDEIKPYVDEFIEFAKNNTNLTFFVTEIGCGLAGLDPSDVAQLFIDAINIPNIYLPLRFWNVLVNKIILPKFVKLNNSALRLDGKIYYRDGGNWWVEYKIIDGVLMSWNPYSDMKWLHKQPLIEITEDEWRKNNGVYAPNYV